MWSFSSSPNSLRNFCIHKPFFAAFVRVLYSDLVEDYAMSSCLLLFYDMVGNPKKNIDPLVDSSLSVSLA